MTFIKRSWAVFRDGLAFIAGLGGLVAFVVIFAALVQ
jgi:hypothetical protein